MTSTEQKSKRKLLHTRQIVCSGYAREDGLYEVEGRMQDISPVATELYFHDLEAGGVIHDMQVRLTVDGQLLIQQAEVRIAASPTPFCPQIESAYAALVGVRIGPGFTQTVKRLFGGTKGCTHVSELLGPVATTAYQSLFAEQRAQHGRHKPMPDTPTFAKPKPIDSCHALRREGEIAQQLWPQDRRPVEDQ